MTPEDVAASYDLRDGNDEDCPDAARRRQRLRLTTGRAGYRPGPLLLDLQTWRRKLVPPGILSWIGSYPEADTLNQIRYCFVCVRRAEIAAILLPGSASAGCGAPRPRCRRSGSYRC